MGLKQIRALRFVGVPSGDGESACWDVTREEFIRLTQRTPDGYDLSFREAGLYRFYPTSDLNLGEYEGCKWEKKRGKPLFVEITISEISPEDMQKELEELTGWAQEMGSYE